jgi:hypothetical protein
VLDVKKLDSKKKSEINNFTFKPVFKFHLIPIKNFIFFNVVSSNNTHHKKKNTHRKKECLKKE